MIVTCPACSTRYLVEERNLGATGRMVRCSQCGHSWYEAPPTGEPLRVDLSEPEAPPPMPGERRGLPVVSKRRREGGGGGGWLKAFAILVLLLVVLGVALLAAAIVLRGPIMARVPMTRVVYEHLGKAMNSANEWLEGQKIYQWAHPSPQLQPLPGANQNPNPNPNQTQSPAQNQPPSAPGAGLVIQGLSPKRDVKNNIPVLVISGRIVNSSSVLQVVPTLRVTLHDAKNNTVASWTFSPDQASLPPGGSEPFETSMAQPSELASGVVVTFESQ
jgi:predicted Zn finger-like uncharacterized protein